MDELLADAARAVEASGAAWTEVQRRFRKLADALRAVEVTVERQAGSLADVSHVLCDVGEAAPCPSPSEEPTSRHQSRAVTQSQTAAHPPRLRFDDLSFVLCL